MSYKTGVRGPKGNIHGMSRTKIYGIWANIVQRCTNPNSTKYQNYGGREIKVCDRWLEFINFYDDMGDRPSEEYSIELKNNDGDYEPDNCVWILKNKQMSNTTINRYVTAFGRTQTVAEWVKEIGGISSFGLRCRLNLGESPESELTRPSLRPKKKND